MHPSCSNPTCTTCKTCRSVKCKDGLNCDKEPEPLVGTAYDMLKKTKLCSACRALSIVKCDVCGAIVSKSCTNKRSWKEVVQCTDCLHPPCSNKACKTCKVCRDPTCKSSDCKQKPKALNPKELVVLNDKKKYMCQTCLFPSCEKCKVEMPKTTRERRRKNESWMDPNQQRTWMCQDCEARENFRKRKA